MRTFWIAQEALLNVPWDYMGRSPKKKGRMCMYDRFPLLRGRDENNTVKQLNPSKNETNRETCSSLPFPNAWETREGQGASALKDTDA